MKFKYIFLTSVVLLSFATSSVLAEGYGYGREKKIAKESPIASVKPGMFRGEGVKTLVSVIENAVVRLEKIISKIEARVAKIKAEDNTKDLSKIESEIKTASDALDKLKTDLSALKTKVDTALLAENPKMELRKLLPELKTINKNLKTIHKNLVKVIGDIKGLRTNESK